MFFHYWQNVFCDRVKWFRRLGLVPGRSLENPDIDYEEQWRQYTPITLFTLHCCRVRVGLGIP